MIEQPTHGMDPGYPGEVPVSDRPGDAIDGLQRISVTGEAIDSD